MSDTRERVVATIFSITKPERPDLSDHAAPLLASALDSLDFASLLMALEDEFGIALADEKTEQLSSINRLVDFIEARKAA